VSRRVLRTLLLVGAVLLGARADAAEPFRIRVGWVVVPPDMVPLLFETPGIAKHLGQSFTLEPVHFASTPPMIQALATGELEIAPMSFFAVAAAIQNAGLDDLRLVADEFQDGVAGYFSAHYLVRKDSGIATVEDLKGKSVSSFGVGSLSDMVLRVMMAKHHLDPGRDMTMLQVLPANQKAMLLERKVDLIYAQATTFYDPELQQATETLFTNRDALGAIEAGIYSVRAGVLAQHRAAIVDFLEDLLRSVRWYHDPAHHQEAVAILARFTKLPAEHFQSWAFTPGDEYRDPNGQPDLAALQRTIDNARDLGFLKSGLDVQRYADLSLVTEAARRLP
jgi:sulfonate transport system substrate-binding protein